MAGARNRKIFLAVVASLSIGLLSTAAYLIWRPKTSGATVPFDPAAIMEDADADFARPEIGRPLVFPKDHGAHEATRGEMWRFVGMLRDGAGKSFGMQLSFYRLALGGHPGQRASRWAATQIYRAHFAVTQAGEERFASFERLSRDALGLAGAGMNDARVWVENWSLEAAEGEHTASRLKIEASEGGSGFELTLTAKKKAVDMGGGAAMRLYALSRMEAKGRLMVEGQAVAVTGDAYFEHGWGNLPSGGGPVAWNRYVIHLMDDRELILLLSRRRDGTGTPIGGGVLVAGDGSVSSLGHGDVALASSTTWRSGDTGIEYPVEWRIQVTPAPLRLVLAPLADDQEVNHSLRYWSGLMSVSGHSGEKSVSGFAHMELTGY